MLLTSSIPLCRQNLAVLLVVIVLCVSVSAQNQATADVAEIESLATKLIAASSKDARTTLLTEKKAFVTPDLRKALIRRGNSHLAEGQYSTAYAIYDLAKDIAEQIGDKEGIAS